MLVKVPEIARSESLPDARYMDRNLAVRFSAKMAMKLQYTVGISQRNDDWHTLYVELTNRQVSWHLLANELFSAFPNYDGKWDGHDVGKKRRRLRDFAEVIK